MYKYDLIYIISLIRKIRLILKYVTSEPRKQTVAIHALPNISRSNENKAMKFGQLMEHNMRKNF